jgi:hypothetical protein
MKRPVKNTHTALRKKDKPRRGRSFGHKLAVVAIGVAVAAGLFMSGVEKAHADLLGTNVTTTLDIPLGPITLVNNDTVIDPGAEITPGDGSQIGSVLFTGESVDFLSASILVTLMDDLSYPGMTVTFSNLQPITGATITTNIDNFGNDDIILPIGVNSVSLDLNDLYNNLNLAENGGYFEVALDLAPTPAPEPGTWMLFGTGLVGLIGTGWKRKRKAAERV